LARLVPETTELELLGEGFRLTEGPVWVPSEQCLLFSDVIGNARHRWREGEGFSQVAAPTRHGNGMTIDLEGRLLVCEHDTSTIARMSVDGSGGDHTVLASHVDGQELNSPNDIVVAASGAVYFSDPPWGRRDSRVGVKRPRTLDFQGVVRVAPDGTTQAVARDFDLPNGLCFSPGEALLYVNDTAHGHIRVFDVQADGTLAGGRVFAAGIAGDTGNVDGMKCDEHGNVYVTGPDGIWVFDPGGTRLGVLHVPERVGNLHWGGPDYSWLLICAHSSVFRLRTAVRGRREPFMR
jgi:gluconolactonase